MFRDVCALTRLSSYREKTRISDTLWEQLLKATFGRAVLITEINEYILQAHFQVTQEDVDAFKTLSNIIRCDLIAEKNIRGRHVPVILP